MKIFEANTHVSPRLKRFVGVSWEDGGYRVDDDGRPTHDPNRNTVALHYERDPSVEDWELLQDVYSGGWEWDDIEDVDHAISWLTDECGFSWEGAWKIVQHWEGMTPKFLGCGCLCAKCSAVIDHLPAIRVFKKRKNTDKVLNHVEDLLRKAYPED